MQGIILAFFIAGNVVEQTTMMDRFTRIAQEFARKPHAEILLFTFAFLEGFILPFPSDLLLAMLVLAHRERFWRFVTINAIGTTIGGVIGYLIGRYGFSLLAQPVLDHLCQHKVDFCADHFMPQLHELFQNYGIWFIGVSAILPVMPYKLGILFAGLAHMSLPAFIAVSFVARFGRYSLVSFIVSRYGLATLGFIEARFKWVCLGLVVAGLAVYAVVAILK